MTAGDEATTWRAYYDAVSGRAPRELLQRALAILEAHGMAGCSPGGWRRLAVDLGCGDGTDAVELLRRGYRVLALDAQPEAIARLEARLPADLAAGIEMQVSAFETMELPPSDFVLASLSLPFCRPGAFPWMWLRIVNALRPSGWFAGHFFGVRDSWAVRNDMTFHTAAQVRGLFNRFTIEVCEEKEEDGMTALKEAKHWHLFSVIACKR